MSHRIMVDQSMGTAYVPFTFPTVTAFGKMKYYGVDLGSFSKVDQMYDDYLNAVRSGVHYIDFNKDSSWNSGIWAAMGKKYPSATIQAFFRALTDIGDDWRMDTSYIQSAANLVAKDTTAVTKAALTVATAAPKAVLNSIPTSWKIVGGVVLGTIVIGTGFIAYRNLKGR